MIDRKEQFAGTWHDMINIRVLNLPHGINADNVSTTTECSLIHGGFMLEVKAKVLPGTLDSSCITRTTR